MANPASMTMTEGQASFHGGILSRVHSRRDRGLFLRLSLLLRWKRLRQPARHQRSNSLIIFLEHHHVPVAVDSFVGEFDPCRMDSGLLPILHRAMVIRRMIRTSA